jgi:hypothetical protein
MLASDKIWIFVNFTNKTLSKLVYFCPLSGAYEFKWQIGHAVAV